MNYIETKLCNLCFEKSADKVKSHIIPKYILKTIFENETGVNRAFLSATNLGHKPTEKRQDSPKESFLLCFDCEKRLENIETYCASRIKLPSKTNYNSSKNISILKIEKGLDKILYTGLNTNISTLLILSIIWRLSISNFKAFKGFSISPREIAISRQTILQRTSSNYDSFLKLNETKLNLNFSFVLMTSHHHSNKLKKSLFIHPSEKNPYFFILGEFILYTNFTDMNWDKSFKGFFNYNRDDFAISRINGEAWDETINLLFKKFRESNWYHLKKNKKVPHKSRITAYNNGYK